MPVEQPVLREREREMTRGLIEIRSSNRLTQNGDYVTPTRTHTKTVSYLVGVVRPVNHRGLHQGYIHKHKNLSKADLKKILCLIQQNCRKESVSGKFIFSLSRVTSIVGTAKLCIKNRVLLNFLR